MLLCCCVSQGVSTFWRMHEILVLPNFISFSSARNGWSQGHNLPFYEARLNRLGFSSLGRWWLRRKQNRCLKISKKSLKIEQTRRVNDYSLYILKLISTPTFSVTIKLKKSILYKALNAANFSKIRSIVPTERNKENRKVIPLLHGKQGSRAKVALKSRN